MTKDKSYPPRQSTDDKIIVEEMLRDSSSGQWHECYVLVMRLVQLQAHNISTNHWDDIVQEAMIRIHKYLPTFQFQCGFKTWIFHIVRSCTIDAYRKSLRAGQNMISLGDSHDDVELESDRSNPKRNRTILNMVLFESRSLEETAQTVGCSAPVVGYVVRSAQRYVREKLEHQR